MKEEADRITMTRNIATRERRYVASPELTASFDGTIISDHRSPTSWGALPAINKESAEPTINSKESAEKTINSEESAEQTINSVYKGMNRGADDS